MPIVRRTPSFRIRLRRQRRVRPPHRRTHGHADPARKSLRAMHRAAARRQPNGLLRRRRHTARRRTPPLRRPDPRHGHQCRAPRVPDQRPERRAEPDLRRSSGRTPHHRAPLDDRSHGRLCRAARHGAGAQRIHRTAPRRRHDLGRNLRRRADGGHLPRRRRDRLDPHGVDGLLAQRRRPRRSPDMRLPGDFPPGSAQPHDAPRSHPRLGHDHAPCRRAALRRIRHPRQPRVRHRAGSGLHNKTRRSEDFSGRTAQYIIL